MVAGTKSLASKLHRRRIKELRELGLSNQEIADSVGLTYSRASQVISEMIAVGELTKYSNKRNSKYYRDQNMRELIRQCYNRNWPLQDIAESLKIPMSGLCRALKEMRDNGEIESRQRTELDWRKVIAMLEKGKSYQEVGDYFGVSGSRIGQILKEHGSDELKARRRPGRKESQERKDRHANILKMIDDGYTWPEIAELLGVSLHTIRSDAVFLRREGLIV